MPKILAVDDERDLLTLLDFNLRQEGFEVVLADSGQAALAQVQRSVPDLVLLDLMLPDIAGADVFRAIEADPRTSHVPVIMLTARNQELDRVVGLELGADDYVTKPFSFRELALRIRAVLRRAATAPRATAQAEVRTLGAIRLDLAAHRAFVAGEEVSLTPLEFRLLRTLMERAGRVQTREQLIRDVWELSPEMESRTVDTHVKRLREKLGPARGLLETVRGLGYRLSGPGQVT